MRYVTLNIWPGFRYVLQIWHEHGEKIVDRESGTFAVVPTKLNISRPLASPPASLPALEKARAKIQRILAHWGMECTSNSRGWKKLVERMCVSIDGNDSFLKESVFRVGSQTFFICFKRLSYSECVPAQNQIILSPSRIPTAL